MKGFLLDTHAILWWLDEPSQLSPSAREAIADADNFVFVSAAVAWEMAIKKSIGRLDFPGNFPDVLDEDGIEVLDINIHHALAVADLPTYHNDPCDRLQIAQAIIEDLVLITRDKYVREYAVEWMEA